MRYLVPALLLSLLQSRAAAAGDFSACLQDSNAGLKLAGCSSLILARPAFAAAYCGRGDALSDLGRLDEAVADYSKAIGFDANLAAAYYNRGLAYLSQGKAIEALADFDAVLKRDGSDATAHNARAMALGALGRLDDAEAGFAKAIGLDPNYERAYLGRATLNLGRKRFDAALADFAVVLRLHPGDREAMAGRQLASLKGAAPEAETTGSTTSLGLVTGTAAPSAADLSARAIRRAQLIRRHRKAIDPASDPAQSRDPDLQIVLTR